LLRAPAGEDEDDPNKNIHPLKARVEGKAEIVEDGAEVGR
jgi:hypothetical protein